MLEEVTEIGYCRWCRHVLPRDASICTRCSLHQNKLFERAKQAISVATLFSLVTSAAVFVWPFAQQRYYEFFSAQSLEVVSFRTDRSGLLSNTGKIAVFASHIDILSEELGRLAFLPIGQTLEPGEIILVDTKGLYAKRVEASERLPALEVSINAPSIVYDHLARDDIISVYFSTNDFEYIILKRGLENEVESRSEVASPGTILPLNVKPAVCRLHYTSAAQGKSVDEFSCVVTVATKGSLEDVLKELQAPT